MEQSKEMLCFLKRTYAVLDGEDKCLQDYHEWFDGECGIVLRKNADGIWGMTSEGLGKIANASDADSMATDFVTDNARYRYNCDWGAVSD